MLVVASLFFAVKIIEAQLPGKEVTVYTEADGLSNSIIRCVLQDSRGMLWIGTPDGLNYFDGHSFKTFRKSNTESNTIKENFITKLAEDQVGDIWIGYLQGGVSCYNISTGVFRHYPLKLYSDSDHIKVPEITMLFATKKNDLLIGIAQNGIYRLNKHSGAFKQFDLVSDSGESLASSAKAYNTAYAAYEETDGKFWFATAAGLYDLDPRTEGFTLHRNTPLERGEPGHGHFMCIAKQGDGFWLGSWSGGLAYYEPTSKKWNFFRYAPLSPNSNIIMDLRVAQGDSILFISNDKGLGYFDTKTRQFLFTGKELNIQSGDYKSLYADRSNNSWIASSKGLIKIREHAPRFALTPLPVFPATDTNLYNARVAFENERFLLIGTSYSNGLRIKDKSAGKEYSLGFETMSGENNYLIVTDILQDSQGIIWVLTRDYIYYLDLNTMQLKKRNQPVTAKGGNSNYFHKMQDGGNNTLWIATLRNGVFLYDITSNEFIRHYTTSAASQHRISTNYIRALLRSSTGDIWIGGTEGFLGRIDPRTGEVQAYSTYYPGLNVNINTVNDIVEDKQGRLWIGTDAGLLLFFKEKDHRLNLERAYTSDNGIPSDIVKSIVQATDGSIWCLTETSLCRLNPETERIASYGFSDGLQKPGIGEDLQTAGNGKIFLGTSGGYYLFDPLSAAKLQAPPPILITSFAVNGQQRSYTSELAAHGYVDLAPSDNRVSFEFTSINFSGSTRQQYAYMLEGLDTGWTNTFDRYISYANLQPGNYSFKLRAIGGIFQKDSEMVIVPLHVAGHFYNTAWFRIAVVLLLLGTIYAIYTIRLRNQRRVFVLESKANLLEKEKAMIMYESLKNQLNPHFLFNSLTSLSSLIRVNQKLASEFLDGLSNTYRYILNSRDRELVPLVEEMRFCETYIKLQKTRFRDALQVTTNVKEEHLHMKLPAVTLQNMLENAIKHNVLTEEEPLMIDISTNEDSELVVTNNLNKKPFVETSNRKGLASLRKLYGYLSDKTITVIETDDQFIIKLPLI